MNFADIQFPHLAANQKQVFSWLRYTRRVIQRQIHAQTSNMIKNYKSFIVHGSFVDIMAIQIHFKYISMIIHFSHNEHFKVICLVVCSITNFHFGMYGV